MKRMTAYLWIPALMIVIALAVSHFKLQMQVELSAETQKPSEAKTHLKVALWDYEYQSYDKKLIDAFCEAYPDIDIEVVSAPNVYYQTKISSWLSGNEGIDVVYMPNFLLYEKLVNNHFLMPLNAMIKKCGLDIERYRKHLTLNGQVYGIPYRNDWMVVYYNKDIFDELGVDYPTDEMTWQDYKRLALRLTHGTGENKVYGALNTLSAYSIILPSAEAGKTFDYLNDDFEMFRISLQLFSDMQNLDRSAPEYVTALRTKSDQRLFELGQIGMMVNGTWFANYLKEDQLSGISAIRWGMIKLPHWKGKENYQTIGMSPVAITANTMNKEAAWTFVQFVAGREGAALMADELMLPASLDGDILERYLKNPSFPAGSEKAITETKLNYERNLMGRSAQRIQNGVYEAILDVMTNNQSVDEAIERMKAVRRVVLTDANEY